MTLPRQILPGKTHFITRRCTQRQFLLSPSDDEVNQIVEYSLGYAAERTGVELHTVCCMSDHWHVVVTDVEARLPEFLREAHRLIAKCMNLKRERRENFWASGKTSVLALEDADIILEKIVYALTNPQSAGLVKRAHEWPGVTSAKWSYCGPPIVVDRPKILFRDDGSMPDQVRLNLVKPAAFSSMSDKAFEERVQREVQAREEAILAEARAKGRPFLGAKACRQVDPEDRARSEEPFATPCPRFLARDAAVRKAARERIREFVAQYREAYEAWKAGDRQVEFPPGTYWLRIHARVRCRAPT